VLKKYPALNGPMCYDVGCGGLLWARKSRATFWSQSIPEWKHYCL